MKKILSPEQGGHITEDWMLVAILSNACGNPENFTAYQDFTDETHTLINSEEWKSRAPEDKIYPTYDGWMNYDITVHCIRFTVTARHDESGAWVVREYVMQDH